MVLPQIACATAVVAGRLHCGPLKNVSNAVAAAPLFLQGAVASHGGGSEEPWAVLGNGVFY